MDLVEMKREREALQQTVESEQLGLDKATVKMEEMREDEKVLERIFAHLQKERWVMNDGGRVH